MTHYETLGVGEKATQDEIKRAYRKLASQHHPDKGGDKAKFQEIQVAYDTISDDGRRQQYDMERQGMGRGQHFHFHSGNGGIDEIFRQFGFGFGNGADPFGQFRHPQQPRRNKDLRIEIPIPLVSTLEEQTKTIQVKTTNGESSTLEVKIPRGVTAGTNIKYAGLGDNLFNTLPRGDLFVQFRIHDAENFIVNGIDLHTGTSVNCLLAVTGGKITIPGLDGKQFELTLPKGTQPGMKFRIPQHGLYQLNTDNRGDLYVAIDINVPTNLTDQQLETIQSIINAQ
jgi:DnaJ-class molecular chaperone